MMTPRLFQSGSKRLIDFFIFAADGSGTADLSAQENDNHSNYNREGKSEATTLYTNRSQIDAHSLHFLK